MNALAAVLALLAAASFALAATLWQQVSLAAGRLVTSVATVSVVNPVVSVLLGALVLQVRLDKTPEWHAVLAIGALATAMIGAVVIASASEQKSDTARLAVT